MKESHKKLSRQSVTFRAALAGKLTPAFVLEMRERIEASRQTLNDRLAAMTAAARSGAVSPGITAAGLHNLAGAFDAIDAWRDVLAAYDRGGSLIQGGQETPGEGDTPA